MTDWSKLREAAHEEMSARDVCDTSDKWHDVVTPEAVLELLDAMEYAEERFEDMLRQARSFREAHDSASEIIRNLERSNPAVKLPTTKLWAGKVSCYESTEIIAILAAAGIALDTGEQNNG